MYSCSQAYSQPVREGYAAQAPTPSNSYTAGGLEQELDDAPSYATSGQTYTASSVTHISSAYEMSKASAASTYEGTRNYAAGEMQIAAFDAGQFLDPCRPATPFVGKAEEIKEHVENAFRELTGTELPHDLIIRVSSEKQLAKTYPGKWSPTIAGFALNRVGWGTSEIFIRQDDLDKVLLTTGHELGHVMSIPLKNNHNEEAKAFAFGMAWMKTIKENNIAGIGHNINMQPAKNGLHDKAFEFVASLVEQGKKAMDVFAGLIHGVIAVR